jgi:cell wall-associated NlpC family hydrolase
MTDAATKASRRPLRCWLAAASLAVVGIAAGGAQASHASPLGRSRDAAALDASNLRLAASAVEAQALATGALSKPIHRSSPAVVLFMSDQALIRAAIRRHPSRRPADTRQVMGAVPYNLTHQLRRRPGHFGITRTRALRRFTHSVPVGGSAGVGTQNPFRGVRVAQFQKSDGVYVDPKLPGLDRHSTIGEVALRTALKELGQPYVWGGAGPATFDCSGLVMRAYARGGVRLTHFAADQWNEARLIPARDALPGDLIMFGHSLFHVAMYLGAGWMLNAPFTGHYVDVVPVLDRVAGVVRP